MLIDPEQSTPPPRSAASPQGTFMLIACVNVTIDLLYNLYC